MFEIGIAYTILALWLGSMEFRVRRIIESNQKAIEDMKKDQEKELDHYSKYIEEKLEGKLEVISVMLAELKEDIKEIKQK